MDYDAVIERAGNDVRGACWVLNDIQLQGILRAAAPILMEYGARLMREAVLPDVQTERTIENHGAHCRCTTCELNITEDSIRQLDPATIVREAVK
jgi:hypothetical protein